MTPDRRSRFPDLLASSLQVVGKSAKGQGGIGFARKTAEPGDQRGIVLKGHFRKLRVLPKGEVERSIEVLTDAISVA